MGWGALATFFLGLVALLPFLRETWRRKKAAEVFRWHLWHVAIDQREVLASLEPDATTEESDRAAIEGVSRALRDFLAEAHLLERSELNRLNVAVATIRTLAQTPMPGLRLAVGEASKPLAELVVELQKRISPPEVPEGYTRLVPTDDRRRGAQR